MKMVVAFSSPKRSAKTVEIAAKHAKALGAELVLLRVVPDPHKVGVVAELIATERPMDKAKLQIDEVVNRLKGYGFNASGLVKQGEIGKTISETAQEMGAEILFVGTAEIPTRKGTSFFFQKRDPIVHYLVDNCPVSLYLVRHADAGTLDSLDDASDLDDGEPSIETETGSNDSP